MIGVTQAGSRLVAVGSRGVVILSDDAGLTWTQATVPVQSDLVAVHFPTRTHGWAVGHDGVVLHSADGGLTWEKQLDGRVAYETFKEYFQAKSAQGGQYDDELQSIESNFARGPSLPYLDVWFQDELTGYAVGSFGLLIATTDGGKNWEPRFDRIDNEEMLHLNGVRGVNGNIYIAGERGIIYRFDAATNRFVKTETGYNGSFFGIVGSDEALVAYGLRGAIYASRDGGTTWEAAQSPTSVTLSSGMLDESSGEFRLVNVTGEMVAGDRAANVFSLKEVWPGARLSGISEVQDGQYVLASPSGVRILTGL
jgi:photosystem II stability/assembly factor-like uncharacterized protein